MDKYWIDKDPSGDEALFLKTSAGNIYITNNYTIGSTSDVFGEDRFYVKLVASGINFSLDDKQMLAIIAWYKDYTEDKDESD